MNQDIPEIEYVFSEHFTAFGKKTRITLHKVIKKTAQHYYIDAAMDYPFGWRGHNIRVFYSLNRFELENEGKAWCKTQRRYYYVLPKEYVPAAQLSHAEKETPPCFLTLGVEPPCTLHEIQEAFRQKVKTVHPDHGGNSEDFISLFKCYEEAKAFLLFQSTSHSA